MESRAIILRLDTNERAHVTEVAIVGILPGASICLISRLTQDPPISEHTINLIAVHDSRTGVFLAALSPHTCRQEAKNDQHRNEEAKQFFHRH